MKKLLVLALTAVLIMSLLTINVSAADFSIPKALTAPTVDGKINADEWANALAIDMKQDNLNWVASVNPSTGNSMFYFMWDAEFIYFAADVKDTTVASNMPAFGGALNVGDGTQWAIYGMDSTAGNAEGEQQLFFSIHPKTDSGAPDVYEHFSIIDQIPAAKIAAVFNGAAYTLECAMPFATFAEAFGNGFINEIKGVVGQQWKMDLVLMDADEDGGQSLGTYGSWFDPAPANVFTLADTGAGIDPTPAVVETEAPVVDEAGEAAPVTTTTTTTAAQTSDYAVISTSVVLLACAAAVVFFGKKR